MKPGIFACIVLLMASPALAAPSIVVETPLHDFGAVTQGVKVDHLFMVRNRGDKPLTITQIRSSCGCTAATLSAKTIAPGKSGEVKVIFDSSNFAGQVTKSVYLDSNDPRTPSALLTMQGKVTELIAATPRALNLGSVKAGSRKEVVVTLENRGNRLFAVTSVTSPQAAIVGTMRGGKVSPGQSGEISVIVTVPKEGRFLSGYLTIRTDHPQKKEIVVPVYATITP